MSEHRNVGADVMPHGWIMTTIGDVLLNIDAGKSPDCPDIPAASGEWGVLKVSAVQPDGFKSHENKIITNKVWINPAYEVQDGDLLISRSNTFQLVGIVCHVRSPQPQLMLCDKTLRMRIDPRRAMTDFVFWQFQQPSARRHIEVHATGTSGSMKNISQPSIRSLRIPLPPLPQQRKITRILTTLDNVIAQTEALIAKYQAIKQGLMHDLFTRGVDATGKLRPPQSEAPELYKQSNLGWIPKDWEVTTVGDVLISIDAGKSPDCPDRPATSGEWGVLKVSAVQPDGFLSIENKVVQNPTWVNPAYEVHDGDLLISRCNTYQLVGLVCLVRSPQPRLMICDKTLRLRVDPRRATVEFLFWLMQQAVVRRHIEVHATGTSGTMKNISQPSIRSAAIMLPSITEQTQIASRIQAIEQRIRSERRTQDKLRTQKIGLMQDLLTGKVPVKADEPEEITSHA
jgi:type I restriction enzyme, S subunit